MGRKSNANGQRVSAETRLKLIAAVIGLAAAAVGLVIALAPYLGGDSTTRSSPMFETERQLASANILLSQNQVENVRQWLKDDVRYQSLARNCLAVMEGKRVIHPIPLDAIDGRFKELLGQKTDAHLEPDMYGDHDRLKVAIFKAWKERNAHLLQGSFAEIIEPIR
jgi:hypothetical protein